MEYILKYAVLLLIIYTKSTQSVCKEELIKTYRVLLCKQSTIDDYNKYRLSINKDGRVFFTNSYLTTIPKEAFKNQGEKIKSLWLPNNHIENIESFAFGNLANVTYIDLSDNPITKIVVGAFAATSTDSKLLYGNLMKLLKINLRNNVVTEFELGGFYGLNDMKFFLQPIFNLTHIKSNNFQGLGEKIHMFSITNCTLEYTETKSFNGMSGLKRLDFSGNKIKKLASKTFGIKDLLFLNMSNTVIYEIDSETFDSLENVTEFLQPIFKIKTLPEKSFVGYPNIVNTLNLSSSGLEKIDPMAFYGMGSLVSLDLSNNNLTILKSSTFKGLSSLTSLNLKFNNIRIIETDCFSSLTKLTDFHMFNIKGILAKDLLNNLNQLKYLDLSNTGLASIDGGIFSNLSLLGYLDVSLNDFFSIGSESFSGLNSLHTLDMTGVTITDISDDAFKGVPNLKRFRNPRFRLNKIPENIFNALSNIQELDLSQGTIENIPLNAFKNLSVLTSFNISYNELTELKNGTFYGLKSLLKLDLQGNRISILESGVFGDMSHLQKLWLNGNLLEVINPDTFKGLTDLKSLNLDGNSIKTMDHDSFSGLKELSFISLENNAIKKLQPDTFHDLNNLETLDLSQNQISDIQSGAFTGLSSLNVLNISSNSLTYYSESVFFPLENLKVLDIENNQLNFINIPNLIDHLPSINKINLGSNDVFCMEVGNILKNCKERKIECQQRNPRQKGQKNVNGVLCKDLHFITDTEVEDYDFKSYEDIKAFDIYNAMTSEVVTPDKDSGALTLTISLVVVFGFIILSLIIIFKSKLAKCFSVLFKSPNNSFARIHFFAGDTE